MKKLEFRVGRSFAQGPGGSNESGGQARPGGSTAHCKEIAPASLTPPPFFPPRTLTSASKIILHGQADWEGLGSQPDSKEGRGISGLSGLGRGPPPRPSHEVWTVWSTTGPRCGHQVHPHLDPSLSHLSPFPPPPPSPVLEREGGLRRAVSPKGIRVQMSGA